MRRRRSSEAGRTDPADGKPVAIDPASGFKVSLSALEKQWDGELIDYRFIDRRNPQDFVRGVPDNQALPYARPEPPDEFIATNLLTEEGFPIDTEQGNSVILTEGPVPIF